MPDTFDPYHKWLGISPKDQPPNAYRLLGLDLFEFDPDVIDAAADQRMAHLKALATGAHSALSQKILNELAAAKICLLNPYKKEAYDADLRRALAKTLPKATPLQNQPDPGLDLESLVSSLVAHRPQPSSRRNKAPWQVLAIVGSAAVALVVVSVLVLTGANKGKEGAIGRQQVARSKPEATVPTEKPKEKPKPEPEPKAKAKQEAEYARPDDHTRPPEHRKVTKPEDTPAAEAPEKAEKQLKQALADAKTPEDFRAVARHGLKVFEKAVAGGQTDLTKRIATIALIAAREAEDDTLAADATFCILTGRRQTVSAEEEEGKKQASPAEGAPTDLTTP